MKKLFLFLGIVLLSNVVFAMTNDALDMRAKKMPVEQADTKEQLVAQLTQGLKTDTEKARVIASWMAYQMDKNGYEYEQLVKASNRNRPADLALENDPFLKIGRAHV